MSAPYSKRRKLSTGTRLGAPSTSSSSSSSQKRPESKFDDEYADFDEADAVDVMPSDTDVALMLLKDEFPLSDRVMPVALVHQIYTLVKDRTMVDRQLDEMKQANRIRIMKILSLPDDVRGVVYTSDYTDYVRRVQKSAATREKSEILDRFVDSVLPHCVEISITKEKLTSLAHDKHSSMTPTQTVAFLVQCGLLTMRDDLALWFAIPGLSPLIQSVINGRKAIITHIRRKRFKEILRKELVTSKRLRDTQLDYPFLLRDMVGIGIIEEIPTTSGPLLKQVIIENRMKRKAMN